MNGLTEEQKDFIVEEYGSSLEIINRIEDIINEINFDEEAYFELIASIASEYETNDLNKYFVNENFLSERSLYKNLKEIIEKVLNFNLKSVRKEEKNYKPMKKALKMTMEKEYI